MKRVFLIVLDSVGVGSAPDSADFGDAGANTLRTIASSPAFSIPNLTALGLGKIEGLDFLDHAADEAPCAAYGRMAELSRGKDTVTGHWEIAGLISERPMPTFPDGFPQKLIDAFAEKTGRGVLCNKPYSGTQVIHDYGRQHMESGDLIVYTSADSVFQIAAHESVVPCEELYRYSRIARELLNGEYAVGRVIARPFVGKHPDFVRTANRHDFALAPTGRTMLDDLEAAGLSVISIGKITDIFAARSTGKAVYTKGNNDGMHALTAAADEDFTGLCFANLVDFDMLYGHRNDVDGYAAALSAFDAWLSTFLPKLGKEDCLLITADHGCDPGFPGTDHTREYVPLLVYGENIRPAALGTRRTFADIAATVRDFFDLPEGNGESFARLLGMKG